jgi:hypothetical protein
LKQQDVLYILGETQTLSETVRPLGVLDFPGAAAWNQYLKNAYQLY